MTNSTLRFRAVLPHSCPTFIHLYQEHVRCRPVPWNVIIFLNLDGYGGWSTDECERDAEADTIVVCECEHLTHFTFLTVEVCVLVILCPTETVLCNTVPEEVVL